MMIVWVFVIVVILFGVVADCADIILDGSKLERKFDGIGGLSGGGATSRFLPSYPEPQRSEIFDYLFTPNFGAALHICKVEIGGDCQTTEGTESSHMHSKDDLKFTRGYEWWIMQEAKKRNPDVILYGLSWGVPGWIGNGTYFSQDNIDYHINWVKGANDTYGLDIDYIGVWNERSWDANWIIDFRKALDNHGFTNTKIVAADNNWDIADEMKKNDALQKSVAIVGAHYPGTISSTNAISLGNPLWASEDYSTYADSTGGGCWGRILNENYVNGYMTSTISWNLVAAYYNELPYGGDGLMWATSPWSGHYDVKSPIWVSAHTTQFTKPGWYYLAHGCGVGKLPQGGSYVTLVPPDNTNGDFSLIVETFSHDHSVCIRPNLPPFNVAAQNVTFLISGGLANTKPLYVWKTHLSQIPNSDTYFEHVATIVPTNDRFTLNLDVDSVFTVSTTTGQKKGVHPAPPNNTRFPTKYSDNFEKYPLDSEADYFMDQTGVWEIYQSGSKVMRQVVTVKPIHWCDESPTPISLIGDYNSYYQSVTVDALIETTGQSIIGTRVKQGGCGNSYGAGYFFSINEKGNWSLMVGTDVKQSGSVAFKPNTWYSLGLTANESTICAFVSKTKVGCITDTTLKTGFVSIGSSWNYVQFDNFGYEATYTDCGVGEYVKIDLCDIKKNNQLWMVKSDATIRLRNDDSKCLTVSGRDPISNQPSVRVLPCASPLQQDQIWKISKEHIVNSSGQCLDITLQSRAQCASVETYECNTGNNQAWQYSATTGLITTFNSEGMCLAAASA